MIGLIVSLFVWWATHPFTDELGWQWLAVLFVAAAAVGGGIAYYAHRTEREELNP